MRRVRQALGFAIGIFLGLELGFRQAEPQALMPILKTSASQLHALLSQDAYGQVPAWARGLRDQTGAEFVAWVKPKGAVLESSPSRIPKLSPPREPGLERIETWVGVESYRGWMNLPDGTWLSLALPSRAPGHGVLLALLLAWLGAWVFSREDGRRVRPKVEESEAVD